MKVVLFGLLGKIQEVIGGFLQIVISLGTKNNHFCISCVLID